MRWQDAVKLRFKKCPDYNNRHRGVRTIQSRKPPAFTMEHDRFGNKIVTNYYTASGIIDETATSPREIAKLLKDKGRYPTVYWEKHLFAMESARKSGHYEYTSFTSDGFDHEQEAAGNPEIVQPCWREQFRASEDGVLYDIVLNNVVGQDCSYNYCLQDLIRQFNVTNCDKLPAANTDFTVDRFDLVRKTCLEDEAYDAQPDPDFGSEGGGMDPGRPVNKNKDCSEERDPWLTNVTELYPIRDIDNQFTRLTNPIVKPKPDGNYVVSEVRWKDWKNCWPAHG
jgi:hypothetical protein